MEFQYTKLVSKKDNHQLQATTITTSKTFFGYSYKSETHDAVIIKTPAGHEIYIIKNPDCRDSMQGDFIPHSKIKKDNQLLFLQILSRYNGDISEEEVNKIKNELEEYRKSGNFINRRVYNRPNIPARYSEAWFLKDIGMELCMKILDELSDESSDGGGKITQTEVKKACAQYI